MDDPDSRGAATPVPNSDAPAAEGTGYTVQPPEGFRDLTSRFDGSAVRVDLAYADKAGSGFATNVVVIREQPGGEFTLDDVMDTSSGEMRTTGGCASAR